MNSEQIKTDKNGVVKIKPISDEQLIINIDKIKSYDIQNIFSMLFNRVIPKIIKRDKENGYISEEQAKFFTETYNLNKFNVFINNAYGESIQDKYYCPQYTSDNNSDEENGYITEEEAKSLAETYDLSFLKSIINNVCSESDRDEEDRYYTKEEASFDDPKKNY